MEQIFVLDEHHKRCKLGKTAAYDCKIPTDEDGHWCSLENGGEYPPWSDTTSVKFAKEVRFLFGVMLRRDASGELVGNRMEPFEYTGKWIIGVKNYAEEMKSAVAAANRLKGGGAWACTKDYTPSQLAELEGGRWEAWQIEKHGSGDGWQDAVKAKMRKGEQGVICVTELMDHAIDQGNKLFANTP
eukprot:2052685-Prymnesium_polylepis.2